MRRRSYALKTPLQAIIPLMAGLCALAAWGGDNIRVSFLNEDLPREDTLKVLSAAGCPDADIQALRRAMLYYDQSPPEYDTSRFPARKAGFYEFRSVGDFIAALPGRLSQTEHPFEINCVDAATFIASHGMKVTDKVAEPSGPYLAISTRTNGTERLIPVATLDDAHNTAYPEWYQRLRETIAGRAYPTKCKALAASLYQFHVLPAGSDERTLDKALLDTLRRDWSRCRIAFSKRVCLTILHRVRLDCNLAVSDHMGVLVKTRDGFMYIEKCGGQGPFLRIDTPRAADIAAYYSTMASPDYPINFMTINDKAIMRLSPSASGTPMERFDARR